MPTTTGIYCLNTSTIRNCGLTLPQKIEVAARTGYDGIELWVSEIDEYLADGGSLADLKALVDRQGIVVPNLIAFFQWANPDPTQRQAALQEARGVFQMAEALGCPYVAAPPAGLADRSDVPLADIAIYYRELLAATDDLQARPLLEFWGHSKTLGSLKEALEVKRTLDDPRVLLLADVFHMAKTPGSTPLLRELDGAELGLFHINDHPDVPDVSQLSDTERVYPGDGGADFEEIIGILREIGYDGMYSLELFNADYEKAGAEAVARTGLAKMEQVIAVG